MLELLAIFNILISILEFKDIRDLLSRTSLALELIVERQFSSPLEIFVANKRKLVTALSLAWLRIKNG